MGAVNPGTPDLFPSPRHAASARPAEGSCRTRVPRPDAPSTPKPSLGPQAFRMPTCVRTRRPRSGEAPRSPPLPQPTSPEEPLQEATREAATLWPRRAAAAHGTVLFPPSRSPTAHELPKTRSNIPRVRSGGRRRYGDREER